MLSRPRRALVAAVAAVGVLVPSAFAVAQSADRGQLDEARARLAQIVDEIDAAVADADDADGELADADDRLREVEAVVNDVAAQLDRQRGEVADAQARLAAVEREAVEVRERLAERAASMFKQGAVREFDVLLASDGADEAFARSTYLRVLTTDDAVTTQTLQAAEVRVDAERERLEIEEQRLDDLLAEQEELLAEVERIRDRRALEAADARARVDQLEREQDDLEAESAELERLIREQQAAARARPAPPPAPSSGGGGQAQVSAPSASGYAWPLCAPVTSEYGPRWGRMHQGIDQGAPTGRPIGASKAGQVIFAGWQGGYGNIVLIDHGDGVVTAYAHQSSMAVSAGTSVSQGQTIGYIGSTGNSTGPHLHFETRVNGSAVNPRNYLSGSPC